MQDAIKFEKRLSDEITVIRKSCQEFTDVITTAENDKIEGRRDYENFLGQGNEAGMSGALRRIREANKKVEALPNRREEFYCKFRELEGQYKDLLKVEQRLVKEAKAVLDQAQKDFERVENRNVRVRGIQTMLNELKSLILNSHKVKAFAGREFKDY